MAGKTFDLKINPEVVVYTTISTSKEGYNHARIVSKTGEKEYLSVSYEWEGEKIPEFAMNLMDFMKRNSVEKSSIWPGKEEAALEYAKLYATPV